MNNNKRTIVDVRTSEEFMEGNVKGSINIPLQEIQQRVNEIKQMQPPIVFCCLSGTRSEQATRFLKAQGIECENGGSWMEVNDYNYQTI